MLNIAISVKHLTKIYKLYDKPIDRLKESLHPLKKQYHREFYALNDVSFEIKRGETVGIIGNNGAGKSTLLKIITGVLTPTSGSVHINGRIASLLELGTGFNPEYTGIENIYFQGSLMGYTREEMEAKVDDILAFADIGDFVYQPVKMYSSGMFARLAFAVAINVDPEILIVDEALSVGDAFFVNKCYNKINNMKKKGMTLLFVSHSMDAILSLCSDALLIENGKCLLYDNAESAVNSYNKIYRSVQNNMDDIDSGNVVENDLIDYPKCDNSLTKKQMKFIHNETFIRQQAGSRFGTGDAKIVNIELIDGIELLNRQFAFSSRIKLRIHIETYKNINKLNCGYFIKSDKGISILGANFESEEKELPTIRGNKKIIVDFDVHLSLKSGIYSITVALGSSDSSSNQYIVDWIDLADSFEVYHKANQYSFEYLVHIPNEIILYDVE